MTGTTEVSWEPITAVQEESMGSWRAEKEEEEGRREPMLLMVRTVN